ncbi:HD domain-containing protein [Desulfatirhabdium butyrativorans]|uniref:HD domain-containing protein n=1 Tax=Desulfatirhabdium butyrativorans TaxID=340467 RepID=UPI00040B5918|nr:HD domain-containing protein [Desulfatirhabdium butyrativorans]
MIDRKAVEAAARSFFGEGRGSHGWDHTLRVLRLAQRIGGVEGADPDVLLVASLLHDIGRRAEDECRGSLCHAMHGARLAEPVLQETCMGLSGDQRENVLHCIRSHRFRGREAPESLEARVIFDADKLDAIGAIGVARAYLFAGEIGARLHCPEIPVSQSLAYSMQDTGYREYVVKLSRIRECILTGEGRRIAEERHRFMAEFFERFLQEIEGER